MHPGADLFISDYIPAPLSDISDICNYAPFKLCNPYHWESPCLLQRKLLSIKTYQKTCKQIKSQKIISNWENFYLLLISVWCKGKENIILIPPPSMRGSCSWIVVFDGLCPLVIWWCSPHWISQHIFRITVMSGTLLQSFSISSQLLILYFWCTTFPVGSD